MIAIYGSDAAPTALIVFKYKSFSKCVGFDAPRFPRSSTQVTWGQPSGVLLPRDIDKREKVIVNEY
jgi:hypothetical protein